jgi:DNA-binding NtrC family response regulator
MARHFLQTVAARLELEERCLTAEDEATLLAHDFPGNVRELQNLLERALVLAPNGKPELALRLGRSSSPAPSAPAVATAFPADLSRFNDVVPVQTLRDFERRNILNALERCDWQISGARGAAKILGMSPSTLSYQMKQLAIERPR